MAIERGLFTLTGRMRLLHSGIVLSHSFLYPLGIVAIPSDCSRGISVIPFAAALAIAQGLQTEDSSYHFVAKHKGWFTSTDLEISLKNCLPFYLMVLTGMSSSFTNTFGRTLGDPTIH